MRQRLPACYAFRRERAAGVAVGQVCPTPAPDPTLVSLQQPQTCARSQQREPNKFFRSSPAPCRCSTRDSQPRGTRETKDMPKKSRQGYKVTMPADASHASTAALTSRISASSAEVSVSATRPSMPALRSLVTYFSYSLTPLLFTYFTWGDALAYQPRHSHITLATLQRCLLHMTHATCMHHACNRLSLRI